MVNCSNDVDHSDEILRLRAAVRDLLALSIIPEHWMGREPSAIAAELADLLIGSFGLDFAFVRLCDPTGRQVSEVTRGSSWKAFPEWLERHVAVSGQISKKEIVTNVDGMEKPCCGMVIPIGINSGRGLVAVASHLPDFPDQIDQQLLSVAANNAATAFQNAFLINELRSAQEALRDSERKLRKGRDELEIKVAERTSELGRSETELRQILDLTPDLIAVFGPHRERLYVNRMALDYFGLTLDEWRNTAHGALGHPDDTKRVQVQWDRAMSNGSAFEIEVRMRKADGALRWFLNRFNPLRDDEGQVLQWYVACTDIEHRRRDEERLLQENAALREEINQASTFGEIVGSSEPLQKVLAQVSKVAPSDSTVLVLGETGTGKELIARAIHKRSRRAAQPFIGVNCGAIPVSLIASELFGHEKGAFTGATQRRLGRFEAANGGTIFLDEVGDLPPDVQIALLRVLQEREIERVGTDKPIPVDVRVMAATHRDLEKLVSEGKFRQDLLYRLNVVPITMPSLRERAADIPVLVEYFIARFGKKAGKKFRSIDRKTLDLLKAYRWPGNIRELQNVIERAVILSDSNIFAVDEAWLKREPSEVPHSSVALTGVLLAHEKEAIEAALAQSHGRVSGPTGAAARLGVPDSTLDSKIKRLGINKYRFKPR